MSYAQRLDCVAIGLEADEQIAELLTLAQTIVALDKLHGEELKHGVAAMVEHAKRAIARAEGKQ